jgi:cytochrome c5
VGSLLENKTITRSLIAALLTLTASLCAADDIHQPSATALESIYPTYPPTTAQNPEQERLIKKGEYLAKMGDCIACHTNVKGGTPSYAGGLSIATPFGTFYSPNITPDKKTGIGTWTEADFIRALKEGKNPQGDNYFPVFPYIYFANTSDDDARAMYAYFMSIPPVEQQNKPLPFPFNVPGARSTLFGWDLLFFYPNNPVQNDPKQTPTWNRGRYIVDGLGHCSMCHTPLNPLGAPKTRHYLTGTFIDGWWAPNITKEGLASAKETDVAEVFSKNQLINHAGPVAGPMAEVNYNSLRHLTEADQLAVAHYLKTVSSDDPHGLAPSQQAPTLSRGKQVYLKSCVLCHQDGQMTAPVIGNGSSWYARLKRNGLTGLYRHAIYGYNSMPVKGAAVTCSDNDIIASVDYLLSHSLSRSQRLDLAGNTRKTVATSGKEVYNKQCSVCHNKGENGAPMIGDKTAWAPLNVKNMDVLVEQITQGKHHPKQGNCKQCTTGELMDAIKYLLRQSKTEGNYSLW